MIDTGSTGFMLVCAMLVLLMTPGLAFFYGGLSRRKNVVNTMVMVFGVLGIVGVVWVVCGWSFAYGGDGSLPFFGGFDQIGCLSADVYKRQGDDSKLSVAVHVEVYYGYVLPELAAQLRSAIAEALATQAGVEVSSVDVYIDGLQFKA